MADFSKMSEDELLRPDVSDSVSEPMSFEDMSEDELLKPDMAEGTATPPKPEGRSLGFMERHEKEMESTLGREEQFAGEGLAYSVLPFYGTGTRAWEGKRQKALDKALETGEIGSSGDISSKLTGMERAIDEWNATEGAKHDLYQRALNGDKDADYSPIWAKKLDKDGKRYVVDVDENGNPYLDEKYSAPKDEARKAYVKELAAEQIGEKARIQRDAQTDLANNTAPWYMGLAHGATASLGFAGEFALGGVVAKGVLGAAALSNTRLGLAAARAAQGAKLGWKGKTALTAAEVATPTVVNAVARYENLTANDYRMDDDGNVYLAEKGDEDGLKAATKAIGGAAFENATEVALGAVVNKIFGAACKGFYHKCPGVKKLFDGAMNKIGDKPIEAAKNAWFKASKTYADVQNAVHFELFPAGEFAEEYVQGFGDEVLGFDTRSSAKTKTIGEFSKDFISLDAGFKDLFFGVMGQTIALGVGGHTVRRAKDFKNSVDSRVIGTLKTRYSNEDIAKMGTNTRLALAMQLSGGKALEGMKYGVRDYALFQGVNQSEVDKFVDNVKLMENKEEYGKLSDEQKLKLAKDVLQFNAVMYNSALAFENGVDGATELLDGLNKRMRKYIMLAEERTASGGMKGVANMKPQDFASRVDWSGTMDSAGNINWQTDEKTGAQYIESRPIGDTGFGARIYMRGDKFLVVHPQGTNQNGYIVDDLKEAHDFAASLDQTAQMRNKEREVKTEFIKHNVQRLVPTTVDKKTGKTMGASVVIANDAMDAVNNFDWLSEKDKEALVSAAENGTEGGGFRASDGTVIMLRDNIRDANDALLTLAHEIGGHVAIEEGAKDKGLSLIDTIAEVFKTSKTKDTEQAKTEYRIRRTEGESKSDARATAQEEGMVYGNEYRMPVASPLQKAKTAVKTWMKKHGIDAKMTDEDYIAIAAAGLKRIEQTRTGETNTQTVNGEDVDVVHTVRGTDMANRHKNAQWVSDYYAQREKLNETRAALDAAEAAKRNADAAAKEQAKIDKAVADEEERQKRIAESEQMKKDAESATKRSREGVADILAGWYGEDAPGVKERNAAIVADATDDEIRELLDAADAEMNGEQGAMVDAINRVHANVMERAAQKPTVEDFSDMKSVKKNRDKAKNDFVNAVVTLARTIANRGSKGIKISEAKKMIHDAANGLRRLPQMPWRIGGMDFEECLDEAGNINKGSLGVRVAHLLRKAGADVSDRAIYAATSEIEKELREFSYEHVEGQNRENERFRPIRRAAAKNAAKTRAKNRANMPERKILDIELERAYKRYQNALDDVNNSGIIRFNDKIGGTMTREVSEEEKRTLDKNLADAKADFERLEGIIAEYDATTQDDVDAYNAAVEESEKRWNDAIAVSEDGKPITDASEIRNGSVITINGESGNVDVKVTEANGNVVKCEIVDNPLFDGDVLTFKYNNESKRWEDVFEQETQNNAGGQGGDIKEDTGLPEQQAAERDTGTAGGKDRRDGKRTEASPADSEESEEDFVKRLHSEAKKRTSENGDPRKASARMSIDTIIGLDDSISKFFELERAGLRDGLSYYSPIVKAAKIELERMKKDGWTRNEKTEAPSDNAAASEDDALTLDGGTAHDIAAEQKRVADRKEIERRQNAPLKSGTGEVGQSLMDLGGAEGEDLFNRTIEQSAAEEKNNTDTALYDKESKMIGYLGENIKVPEWVRSVVLSGRAGSKITFEERNSIIDRHVNAENLEAVEREIDFYLSELKKQSDYNTENYSSLEYLKKDIADRVAILADTWKEAKEILDRYHGKGKYFEDSFKNEWYKNHPSYKDDGMIIMDDDVGKWRRSNGISESAHRSLGQNFDRLLTISQSKDATSGKWRRTKEVGIFHGTMDEYIDKLRADKFSDGETTKSGAQSIVKRVGDKVVKFRNGDLFDADALANIAKHNELFPDTPYTIVGVAEENGRQRIILEQPYIDIVPNSGTEARKQLVAALKEHFGAENVTTHGDINEKNLLSPKSWFSVDAGPWHIEDLKDLNLGIDRTDGNVKVWDAEISYDAAKEPRPAYENHTAWSAQSAQGRMYENGRDSVSDDSDASSAQSAQGNQNRKNNGIIPHSAQSSQDRWRRRTYTPNTSAQYLADLRVKSVTDALRNAKFGADNAALFAAEKAARELAQQGSVSVELRDLINATQNGSVADRAKGSLKAMTSPQTLSRMREKFQDSLISMRELEDRLGIAKDRSVYHQFDRNYGIVTKEVDDLNREIIAPIAKELETNKIPLADFSMLLQALHGPERNRMIAERSPYVQKALNDPASEPYVTQIFAGGIDVDDAQVMEICKRLGWVDKNGVITKEGKAFKDDLAGSGATTAYWNGKIDEFRRSGMFAKADKAVKLVRKLTRRNRALLVATGRMSRAQASLWAKLSPNYVPLRSDMEMDTNLWSRWFLGGESNRNGGTRSYSDAEYNHAYGRGTLADNPLEFAIQQYHESLQRAYDNVARQRLAEMVRQNPNLGKVFRYEPRMTATKRAHYARAIAILQNKIAAGTATDKDRERLRWYQEAFNADTNIPLIKVLGANGIVHEMPNLAGLEGTPDKPTQIVAFKEGGELKFIKLGGFAQGDVSGNPNLLDDVSARRIATAVKKQNMARLNAFGRLMRKATGIFSALRTAYSPTFIVSNFGADNTQAARNIYATFGVGAVGKFEHYAFNSFGAAKAVLIGNFGNTKIQQYAKEWYENGGKIGGLAVSNISDLTNEIKRTMRKLNSQKQQLANIHSAKDLLAWATDRKDDFEKFAEYWNSVVEMSTRIAAYATARDMGQSVADAVSYSRDITVNFNRKGTLTPWLNAFYAFSNASIQDLHRSLVAFGEGRVGTGAAILAGRGVKMGVGLAFMGFLASLFGFWQDDPDDEKEGKTQWKYAKDWQKQNTMGVRIGEKVYGVPIRGLSRIPYYFGHQVYEMMTGRKNVVKAAADTVGLAASSAMDFMGQASTPVNTLVPSVLRPGFDIQANKTFTGQQLYREPLPGQEETAVRSEMGRKGTSDAAKWTAKMLNAATGGDEGKRGLIDVQPEKIAAVWDWVFGSAGKDIANITGTTMDIATLNIGNRELRNIPYLSRFARKLDENSADYYEARNEYDKAKKHFSSMAELGNEDKMRSDVEEYPWLSSRGDGKRWGNELKDLDGAVKKLLEIEKSASPEDYDAIHQLRLKTQYQFMRRLENPPTDDEEGVEDEKQHKKAYAPLLRSRKMEEKREKREKDKRRRLPGA